MKLIFACAIALGLGACAASDPQVRVEKQVAAPPPAPVLAKARTEPIFYNGKTYTLKFGPAGAGLYDVRVLGMGPGQQKDASNIGTSAIRYFACPDGKTGKLQQQPRYADSQWVMSARCG
jgi:hypothetical protein